MSKIRKDFIKKYFEVYQNETNKVNDKYRQL